MGEKVHGKNVIGQKAHGKCHGEKIDHHKIGCTVRKLSVSFAMLSHHFVYVGMCLINL